MNAPLFVSWFFQISTNAKGTRARMEAFAQIWLPTIPANARGSTWEGTVSTVSAYVPFLMFFIELFSIYQHTWCSRPTPLHHLAGICCIVVFYRYPTLQLYLLSPLCFACVCVCVCSSAPPSVKQTHRPAAFYTFLTDSRGGKQKLQCNQVLSHTLHAVTAWGLLSQKLMPKNITNASK